MDLPVCPESSYYKFPMSIVVGESRLRMLELSLAACCNILTLLLIMCVQMCFDNAYFIFLRAGICSFSSWCHQCFVRTFVFTLASTAKVISEHPLINVVTQPGIGLGNLRFQDNSEAHYATEATPVLLFSIYTELFYQILLPESLRMITWSCDVTAPFAKHICRVTRQCQLPHYMDLRSSFIRSNLIF